MAFLNPLLLWGMAAVAAPIIIHTFMNRRIKQVVWAATRFLQASIQKNQKRMNLEDIVLLLLRCLLLLLLALAMARPIFHRNTAAPAGRSSETAIIVIDNSYSMAESDGGPSRFDLAKQAAVQAIDSMPKGSAVAVLFFSDVVRAAIPEPTFDLDLARKVVRDATLSDRTTDVKQALKIALDTLGRHAAASQHLYLVTDGQANGWGQFGEILKMIHSDTVTTSVILVGGGGEQNLCVSNLQLASSMASVGEAAQFDVEVTNFGTAEARDVAVRIGADAEQPCDEGTIASIPPGSSKRLALFTKFRAAGYHTVTAEINPDRLKADDRRTVAVRALDDVHVLLVSGDVGGEPVGNATFYLAHALTPAPASERANYFIKTKTVGPADMDSINLGDFEAVVLANVPDIPPASVDALGAYLARGGGLIVFPGPKTNAAFYNDYLAAKNDFLPATLGDIRGKPNDYKTVLRFQTAKFENRIVSIWNDAAAGTLATSNFYSSFNLLPAKGRTAQAGDPGIVVKYNDGSPAIMERTWGRGLVILFSSTANTAWNDMPLHPAYLPLIDRTLGAILDRQNQELNVPVGSAFDMVCNQDWVGANALITRPGEAVENGSMRRISMVDGVPLLRYDETDNAGPYKVTVKTEPPATVEFAVQSNPVESNLEPLSSGQLDSLAQTAQLVHWTPETRLDKQAAPDRGGREIWSALAILAIVAACVEIFFAGVFSASK